MKYTIFATLLFALSVATADVLPPTQKTLRFEYSRGSAKQLYAGSNKVEIKDATGNPMRDIANLAILGSFGLGDRTQLDVGLNYSHVDIGNDKTQGGISEILTRLTFDVVNTDIFDFNLGLGFRAPGDNRGGDSFLALSDGLTKYDYYLGLSWNLHMLQLALNSRYTDRSHPISKPQTSHEVSVAFLPVQNLQVAVSYQIFSTQDGFDIGGPGFTGNFSQVKEEFTAFGLGVGYQLTPNYVVDARIGNKLGGRNTDANSTVGLGFTSIF